MRQKTALAALSPGQQENVTTWLNWSAAHKKTSIAILAVGAVWLLAALAKLLS
jgi:hypothetical protein